MPSNASAAPRTRAPRRWPACRGCGSARSGASAAAPRAATGPTGRARRASTSGTPHASAPDAAGNRTRASPPLPPHCFSASWHDTVADTSANSCQEGRRRCGQPRGTERTTWPGRASGAPARGAVDLDRRPVDDDVADAGRLVGGEPFGVGREIAHPANRPGTDGRPGRRRPRRPSAPGRQVAPIGKPEDVGLDTRELADGLSRSASGRGRGPSCRGSRWPGARRRAGRRGRRHRTARACSAPRRAARRPRPRRRWRGCSATRRVEVGLVQGQVEHGVEGLLAAGFGHDVEQAAAGELGMPGALVDSVGDPAGHGEARDAPATPPATWRRHAGSAYAPDGAPRSTAPSGRRNSG